MKLELTRASDWGLHFSRRREYSSNQERPYSIKPLMVPYAKMRQSWNPVLLLVHGAERPRSSHEMKWSRAVLQAQPEIEAHPTLFVCSVHSSGVPIVRL